ncbi:hypothetical protein [Streptomyces sp. NPDC012888]|uniref:hypothetical protein n=1 Tax=Streptomyces sp. NPDC012888 TaxID=3364855 RepID=UPI0036BBAFE2
MAQLTAPTLSPGPRKRLSDALHSAHRRAGWPSVRELARALGTGVVSSSRIHDTFTRPRLPTWGIVQVLVVELANRTPGVDAAAEVKRFHILWDEAAQAVALQRVEDGPQAEQAVPQAAKSGQPETLPSAPVGRGRATPRSLLLVDLEGFSGKDDLKQAYMRRMLYSVLDRVAVAGGVDPEARLQADRGDSVIELIDAAVPMAGLLRALITVAPAEVNVINHLASDQSQLRLRMVLATGSVIVDEHDGMVGAALNEACRLLDSDALRSSLREGRHDTVLCVSDPIYWGTVRQNHDGVPAHEFREIAVPTKSGVLPAWLHQPLSA